MKKLLLLFASLFVLSLGSYSQTVMKTGKVCSKSRKENCNSPHTTYYLKSIIVYDDNMNPNYTFSLLVQNSEYSCLESLFSLKSGSAQEIYDLIVRIEDFGNKISEHSVSMIYDDYKFTRFNWGILGKRICVEKTGESEYHNFKDKDLVRIKNKLVKYCQKRNIELQVIESTPLD